MKIPHTKDIIQELNGKLQCPEIRVWCHPKKGGDDYYYVFDTFQEAFSFIVNTKEICETNPMLAFRGYELNLFATR